MTYFNHPFEPGNEIKLIDDVELENSLSLESLATVFVAKDNKETNAAQRQTKDNNSSVLKKKETEEFEDFDFNKAMNF